MGLWPAGIWRRLALLVGLGLAIAATVALVVTEDAQTLRLAVLAALWAFLIAAFVAGVRRSEPPPAPTPEPEPRQSYGLELASRRESELRLEVQLRREIEGALRQDIAGLRADLGRLRSDILDRWDGELRVERVTLRTESTRITGFGSVVPALHEESLAAPIELTVAPADPPPAPADLPPAPASPPRRRHRYRDDDGAPTDVLSRVLDEATGDSQPTSRRHRRYRDENDPDDVLARVLGGG
ncbi:hypothetical protein BH20ACT5_BH20ACT5_04820 [soil metagenome]